MNGIEAVLFADACVGTVNEVNFIEQVEIIVTIKAANRGSLEIYLKSPMGTRSLILPVSSFFLFFRLFCYLKLF